MTVPELYTVYYLAIEAVDRASESWVSVSFALVVASYIGSQHLTRTIKVLVTMLYGAFCLHTMVTIGAVHSPRILEMRSLLIESGETFNTTTSIASGYISIGYFLLGVSGTLYFVWRQRKSNG